MAYGTALASFNVEEFGTERVERLTADEIAERVADLQRMTSFSAERGRPAGLSAPAAPRSARKGRIRPPVRGSIGPWTGPSST